jgi:hypothetical protein
MALERVEQEESMDGLHHCSSIQRPKMKYDQPFNMMEEY